MGGNACALRSAYGLSKEGQEKPLRILLVADGERMIVDKIADGYQEDIYQI